jgi:transposase
MWKNAEPLAITKQERRTVQKLADGRNTAQKVVLRARIVLGAADGTANNALAKKLGTSRPTVLLWRIRFQQGGVEALLCDAPRPGRKKRISDRKVEAIVNATLHTTPRNATHWSVRSMAKAQKVSPSTVHRIWRVHGLQPHRTETFKLSRDPDFVSKVRDIVGLYLNPPDKATPTLHKSEAAVG